MNDATASETPVFSVSALIGAARDLLEGGLGTVAVEGEISGLRRPGSGHVYFSLKDAEAVLPCVLFRREATRVAFPLADGMQVLGRGRLSIYPAQGKFQLYVAELEEAGLGALQRAFEALKRKLAEEGLFDQALKRPLPRYPRRIGIVTSRTGAALRDILKVLGRRFPAADVLVYPTLVQGDLAAGQIVKALQTASARKECDVIILARGGGSLEDLWSFNEEAVARAIRACAIPVVAGIGHETDFTIADFAADLRAPTPSAAAEAVTPDATAVLAGLSQFGSRMAQAWQGGARQRRQSLAALARRIEVQHPRRRLQERAQRLDELHERLASSVNRLLANRRARLATLRAELARRSPAARLERLRLQFTAQRFSLGRTRIVFFERRRAAVHALAGRLQTLGPEQTLARGYAIVFDEAGRILRDAAAIKIGDPFHARLAHGTLAARVDSREITEK